MKSFKNFQEELEHIVLANEVKELYANAPDGEVVDADTILKDIMDEVSFGVTGLSMELLDIYLNSSDRASIERLFYTFTDIEFVDYLQRCVAETTKTEGEK